MDIVEWLRKEADLVALDRLNEAADVIEQLRTEVSWPRLPEATTMVEQLSAEVARLTKDNIKLEAALHKIEDGRGGDPKEIAMAALREETKRLGMSPYLTGYLDGLASVICLQDGHPRT